MNIYDMIPNEHYLVGDGLGYDKVRCIGQRFDAEIGTKVVDIEYIATGCKDIYFEMPDCGFSTYVEPL